MQQQEKEPQQENTDAASLTAKESIKCALLAGLCLLMLLAPDFVVKTLSGKVDYALFKREINQRIGFVRWLMGGSNPEPIQALRNAIVGQESGGNHALLNASGSGAMGLGQVMPENLPSWSVEAVGREVSRTEFLSNPELQLKIIDYKLQQYWDEAFVQANGDLDETVLRVASWWYSGNPERFTDTTPQYWNGDVYPSIAEYSQQVLDRFREQRGGLV